MRQPDAPKAATIPDDGEPRGLFQKIAAWFFSPHHFRFKLLFSTSTGILVIVILGGLFAWITFNDHRRESFRSHTVEIIRLSSLIENDVAALETDHRGFLLTGDQTTYLRPFERRREQIGHRLDELNELIMNSEAQRKRVARVKEIVDQWLETTALPQIRDRATRPQETSTAAAEKAANAAAVSLGANVMDVARENLQSLQDEEQITLNQRMVDQEWAGQSTQILGYLPKLERAVLEMEKEKRGYILTHDANVTEAYKRAITDFYTYNGYLSILVANNPSQAELLAEIRAKVETWMSSEPLAALGPKRADKAAPATLSLESGEAIMVQIRRMLGDFESNEVGRFDVRTAAALRDRIIKASVLGGMVLLSIALLAVSNSYSFALLRKQLTKVEGVESRIRSIIESIVDGMVIVDENGTISSVNPAAEKIFGYQTNELTGHKISKIIPKVYSDEAEAKLIVCAWPQLAKRTGTAISAQGRTRNLNFFSAEISLSQMTENGQTLYVAMVRDVTERKRIEEDLAAEKEHLAVTLRSIGDGVITTDVEGKVLMMNNEAERLTGWTSREAVGRSLRAVFNVSVDLPSQANAQKSGYRNEAQSILLSLPENANLAARDGVEYIIEQAASPIRDNKNEVAGVVLVFRDITERQRNEAERRKAETLEQLGLLAGGIAHDFNNLLTAIIGNISLASLLLPPDNELAKPLVDAKNASMGARDLAQQLLTFARGGAPIKKTASIGKLIQDTVSFSLRGSHSRSEFTFGAELWPAEIDPGQISQVIGNLVVNADQAMPSGGTLRVNVDNYTYDPAIHTVIPDLAAGDYIRIAIRDEGVGIPEEYLKRIFDPYFTTKPKGTGLGLATTYSIVRNHNGLITVESELHHGTTFTVYLPAASNQQLPESEQVTNVPTAPVLGTGRVLVVDDEEAIRALVDFTLSHLGYEVHQAGTALEGVNLYRQKLEAGERFDVVILDLTLPGGMGGKEALKKLIELDPTVNAIVSSGYATDATMSRYQDFGFRGVIAKPYEAAELGKTVHEVIASSQVHLPESFDAGRLATRVA